ncbi:MAG: DUF2807 domain-containing protein [Treponema sp.]|nr:DUF2807 domain-containing protein [Treponema sp.]
MKRFIRLTLGAIFVIISLGGCVITNFSDSTTVAGTGVVQTFEYPVSAYSRVRAEGLVDIHYRSAPSNIVRLDVQPNLHEYFEVRVIDGELIVGIRRGINIRPTTRPVLTISTPNLEAVIMRGSNNFTAHDRIRGNTFTISQTGSGGATADLDVQSLEASLSGSGDFSFSGRSDRVSLTITGSGSIDALSVETREATVRLSGSGRLGVNSSETLSINASGSGTVSYRGSPRLSLSNTGSVRINNVE